MVKAEMKVVKVLNDKFRRARRGCPSLEPGEPLYVIWYKGRYFSWLYIDEVYARRVKNRLEADANLNFEGNFHSDWRYGLHTFRKED